MPDPGKAGRRRRLTESLFFKLSLFYAVLFMLILSILAWGVFYSKAERVRKNITGTFYDYFQYVAEDIGVPPNLEKAQEINERLGIGIHVEGSGVTWATDPDVLDETCRARYITGTRIFCHGKVYAEVERDGYRFTFSKMKRRKFDVTRVKIALGIVLVSILAVPFVGYFVSIRLFRPIRSLEAGVEAFGRGEYGHRVPTRRKDELGDLSRMFNHMAERIEGQIRSMRDLIVGISHEFRSPLTRMKVALELIQDEKSKKNLAEEIQLLDDLTGAILERERLDAQPDILEKTPVDLRTVASRVVASYKNRAPGISLKVPAHDVLAEIDTSRMSMAFANIVRNALRHSEKSARPVEVTMKATEREAVVRIKDFGEGIPARELPRLGEPFYRPDASRTGERARGGFGVGLSLAKSIVRAHGGRLEIQSELGQWTEVAIALPL